MAKNILLNRALLEAHSINNESIARAMEILLQSFSKTFNETFLRTTRIFKKRKWKKTNWWTKFRRIYIVNIKQKPIYCKNCKHYKCKPGYATNDYGYNFVSIGGSPGLRISGIIKMCYHPICFKFEELFNPITFIHKRITRISGQAILNKNNDCDLFKSNLSFKIKTFFGKKMENSKQEGDNFILWKTNITKSNCKSVLKWLNYPEDKPNIGDKLVICYKYADGVQKTELVDWTFKIMNNSENNKDLKFKWLCLPLCKNNKD